MMSGAVFHMHCSHLCNYLLATSLPILTTLASILTILLHKNRQQKHCTRSKEDEHTNTLHTI
jgi:hypothetical protein